jgi:hypothetical protein
MWGTKNRRWNMKTDAGGGPTTPLVTRHNGFEVRYYSHQSIRLAPLFTAPINAGWPYQGCWPSRLRR